jgi:hypothetical protein
MSQEKAMEKLGMNQNAISRLENPYYGKATLTTLKRIAAAHDVGLLVEFVPFSRLVDHVSGTPSIDPGLSPLTMNVLTFNEELEKGAFEENHPSTTKNFEVSRVYLASASSATMQHDLARQAVTEQSPETNNAMVNVAAPSASGAISMDFLPAIPTGSYRGAPPDAHTPRIKMRPESDRLWRRGSGRRTFVYVPRKKTGRRG